MMNSTLVKRLALVIFFVCCGLVSGQAHAAPVPTASFAGTQVDVLLNQDSPILVGFRNTGDAIGYYPMMEVKLPAGVLCDSSCQSGITLVDLKGAPVTISTFGPAASATTYTNPVTGNKVPAAAGETVLFISLPTGSVSPNQPAITYSIPAALAPSAKLGVPEPLKATGVFALGALANGDRGACGAAGVDTICAAASPYDIIPSILRLTKSVENLVDGSTATGPNYPRRFSLKVEVAKAKTVTGTAVTDTLPDTFVFSTVPGADCKANPGTMVFSPALDAGDTCVFSGSSNGGGTITVTYASITGIKGIDHTIQYTGYIQKFAGAVAGAHIVPPDTGSATTSKNGAQAKYSYNPGTGDKAFSTAQQSVVIEQRSLYTTKSMTKTAPAGPIVGPGSTIRHTLIYDISDYFSFDDLQISDSIGDGQTFVTGSLQVAVFEGSSSPVTRSQAQLQAASGAPLGPITRDPSTGIWSINLDLSKALTAAGPNGYAAADGVLEGDENRSPSSPSGAPTRVVVTYDTTIDEVFTDKTALVGTIEVDGGDVISDTMSADFRIAGTSNRQTFSGPTASVTVTAITEFEKKIVFKNGVVPTSPIKISPTDTVTFKISFIVPTGDVEGLKITDFVPSPLFQVTDPDADGAVSSFVADAAASDAAPATGHMHLTTASAHVGLIPTVDGNKNSVSVEFDNEDHLTSNETLIEFLFTMTATNNPMADDLLLVNVAYLTQNSSQSASPINQLSSVAPLVTAMPSIVIRKFASKVVSGAGSISGSGANANFVNVNPGARLEFTVEIENIGSYDAFDVTLNDPLPAPFTYVSGTLTNATCGGGLVDSSTATEIQLTGMSVPQAQKCTLTYQVDLDPASKFGAVVTNTAVSRFSSTPGGPQFSPVRDSATTTVYSPSLTKTLVAGSSSDPDTAEGVLRAGESAEFDVTVSVPPGTADSFMVRELDSATGGTSNNFFENFSSGTITFPSLEKNSVCAGKFNFVGNTDLCFTLDPSANASQVTPTEHRVNLGTVVNSSTSPTSFTFRYRATLRSGLVAGAYVNTANVRWVTLNSNSTGSSPGTVTSLSATAPFTVVRPKLTLAKSTTTTPPVRLGDSVQYKVTLTNSGTSTAYDVADLVDTLPAGLGNAALVSATLNGSSVTGAPGFAFSQSGSRLSVTVRNGSGLAKLAVGDVYSVTYSVPVTQEVNGSTSSLVNLVAVASYSSGPIDGGPRETLTDVPPASVTIGVDSNLITGRVIFSKETASQGNQNGVTGTTVSINGTSFTTTVDTDGNFSFAGVPDGTYTVRAVSSFGDLISEQTVVVNNGDVKNIVFQARPRIVLTKTTSTIGPVSPGDEIAYSITVQNLGNYPAFQVGDIQDTLVKGMGQASLISATYNGTSVVGVSGFNVTQAGLVITFPVRNPAGEARIDVGGTFVVTYKVPVLTSLKAASITIPNSAEIPSYTTSATTTSSTEKYFDVRCGEVRLDLVTTDAACVSSSLKPSLDSMDLHAGRLQRNVARAIALRNSYARAGYCSAVDNGCYKCNAGGRCLNVCSQPSSKKDKATLSQAGALENAMNGIISGTLVQEQYPMDCSVQLSCSLVDQGTSVSALQLKARKLADMTSDILGSCCMRTRRAKATYKARKASIAASAKRNLKRFSTVLSDYPSPAMVCQ